MVEHVGLNGKITPIDLVRAGFIGVGNMGTVHLRNVLSIPGVEVRAIYDIDEAKVARAQKIVEDAGQPKPKGFTGEGSDYRRLCEEEDLDLIYSATPWHLHAEISLCAMNNGKHVATEIPAAFTIEDCWALVETSEKTGKQCVILENCCYDQVELMILNMVRKGLLGELIHAECGYLHDLRALKLSGEKEWLWRLDHAIKMNCDLYPTHGLGPVAQCMNINRGNQFEYLVSMSSAARGLNLCAEEMYGVDSPPARQKYALGDVVTTAIRTVNGQTIVLTFDIDSPRPYSRNILVQGTKGIVRKYPEEKIYVDKRSPAHEWEPLSAYREEFEHPLWSALGESNSGVGHGGMDYIEHYRLIWALRTGNPPDMDVYDAAAWSAVTALSERSIAGRGQPVDFPDFTRGRWKTREPIGIVTA